MVGETRTENLSGRKSSPQPVDQKRKSHGKKGGGQKTEMGEDSIKREKSKRHRIVEKGKEAATELGHEKKKKKNNCHFQSPREKKQKKSVKSYNIFQQSELAGDPSRKKGKKPTLNQNTQI